MKKCKRVTRLDVTTLPPLLVTWVCRLGTGAEPGLAPKGRYGPSRADDEGR